MPERQTRHRGSESVPAAASARLKAHGHEVRREKSGRLTAECRQQLAVINLRFHDVRREAGSRFLDGGMAANYVQKFLDHAKLSTTSRYLNVNRDGMHSALERFEETRAAEEKVARGKRVATSLDIMAVTTQ